LPTGTRVGHRAFGDGLVVTGEDDRITVLFDAVGYKELLLAPVLEQGLLRRL
jgi:ATP-dependent DNA helicase RecQ